MPPRAQAQQLVAEADAEQRLAGLDQLLDGGDGIVAGGRRIAGAIGQEHAIGIVREDFGGGGGGRKHGDLGAFIGEAAQDIALGAVVDGDDVEFGIFEVP